MKGKKLTVLLISAILITTVLPIPASTYSKGPEATRANNETPFEPVAKIGDADGDEEITAADSFLILRQSVGLENFSAEKIKLCDVDSDGDITSGDAFEVLRYSVGLPTNSKIG